MKISLSPAMRSLFVVACHIFARLSCGEGQDQDLGPLVLVEERI